MLVPSTQKKFTFISHLHSLRILVPVSQSDLAKDLGITRQTLANIENGTAQPSLLTAYRIAQYFRVPIEHLFTFRA